MEPQCYLSPYTSEHNSPQPQPDRPVLNLATPVLNLATQKGWKAVLT